MYIADHVCIHVFNSYFISRAFCETIRMTFGVCVCMCVCVCVCVCVQGISHSITGRILMKLRMYIPVHHASPKGAKVYPASRRRSNKRVGLKGQLAPHCVP